MSKNVKVVIGANFGDEGKGLMTDYFASKDKNSLVVRFNGGAQAGHTVVTPEHIQHVFSHFGSGILAGIPTYLSEFFLVNPLLFRGEYMKLFEKTDKMPKMFVDRNALLSTPYDMIINQAAETVRGGNRHGSCGLGISETVIRSEISQYRLTVNDMLKKDGSFENKLRAIRDEYLPIRLAELGVEVLPDVFETAAKSEGTIHSFVSDCEFFKEKVTFCDQTVMNSYSTLVFEGAQGLLLDQDLEEYSPHITHSSTGLKNVVEILKKANFDYEMEVAYVTRSYLTRHGQGPMPNEISGLPYSKVVDPTNVPNEWQGSLRFGILDLDFLKEHILHDLNKTIGIGSKFSLAVTCLDQVDDKVKYKMNGIEAEEDIPSFLETVATLFSNTGLSDLYESWGRTRETIKECGI